MIATSTITATVIAEAMPIEDTIGSPAICRPRIAMTTVAPAKTTAEPAVALARAAASGTVMPSCRNCRWRVTTNSA
jgi:hypothetical protein